jgi:hypothetical protein
LQYTINENLHLMGTTGRIRSEEGIPPGWRNA